ncbi:MAG: lipopolysaccharide assembly protein LapB [Thiotrichaceae bacterium]|nr:lipopolysaccharide assembly protein LapB [Thiotrichaceae bacterium]
MIDLLWLLLPVAVLSGWLTAYYQKQQQSADLLSPDYFKGLNYLLNEEPDKAIDIFIKLVEVGGDTVETHFALASFFRRRGEFNRAIRLHKNLSLYSEKRKLALFELGLDYRHAGLLDKAEHFFQKLLSSDTHHTLALRQLLEIYQEVQDWEGAINIAQQLEKASNEPMHTIIAQYYCEQGQEKAALKIDPNCVRATLLEAQMALDQGKQLQAISAFQRVEQQNPAYLSEIIAPLQTCYQAIGKPEEFTRYLQLLLERHPGITPMLANLNLDKFIITKIEKQPPSLRGLKLQLDLTLSKTDNLEDLLLLKDMITELLKNKPVYQCNQCGLTAKMLYWQCPACQQWNTLKPIP